MKPLLFITLISTLWAQDFIPPACINEAKAYYAKLDSAQWADVRWHIHYFGYRNAVFAGMEGSNRPRGDHGDEDSHQDSGIYYPTARIYAPDLPENILRESLQSHFYCASLSYAIDRDNLALEYRRGSDRPGLNAAMRYPGGRSWRKRLKYGLAFLAREQVLRGLR